MKYSLADIIAKAGGVAVVSMKTNYSIHAVLAWRSGARRPTKAGRIRTDLCHLAGVRPDDVEWNDGPRSDGKVQDDQDQHSAQAPA